jgi:hypothetical protein
MKTSTRFIAATIIAIFSVFSVAQAADSTKTKTTAVAKPIGARIYNQADLDSLKVKLSRMDGSTPVTVEILMEAMSYVHDATLRDGHREYVSMPGMFKKQVTKNINAKLNTTAAVVGDVKKEVTKVNDSVNDVAYFAREIDRTVANIELVVTDDRTPVIPPAELGTMTGFDGSRASMPANEVAMELIKKSVAARRAAAAATMIPFKQ